MSRQRMFILLGIFGFVAAVAVIIYSLLTIQHEERVRWNETYLADDQQPYGAYFLTELLREDFDVEVLNEDPKPILHEQSNDATYLFLGRNYFMSDSLANSLSRFVRRGNDAFVISSVIPENLAKSVQLIGDCRFWINLVTYRSKDLPLQFNHPDLSDPSGYSLQHYYRDTTLYRPYELIDSSYQYCDGMQKMVPLGHTDEAGINFFVVPHGEGNIYFHTLPLAFTNIQLKDEKMLEYSEKVFSHLTHEKIFFDQYSRLPSVEFNPEMQQSQSPLIFIFAQDSLRWAWYLLLISALLYILFTAKRKQRIIPVIQPKTNTSLQYTETIGRLYHQQKDHRKLALMQMKQFMTYLHRHFNINTRMDEDKLIREISVKTKQPVGKVEELFHKYHWIEEGAFITEDTLIDFYQKLQTIYEHGRKS